MGREAWCPRRDDPPGATRPSEGESRPRREEEQPMCRPAVYAARAHCGPRFGASHPYLSFPHHHFSGFAQSPGLGVRRPLRFLAWKLQLDDAQIKQVAAILDQLKIERAQAEVDDRRAVSLLAEATEGESFDGAKASEAA